LSGRDLLPVDWNVALEDGRWRIIGETAPKKRFLDKVERIERNNEIKRSKAEGMTLREIAEQLGCSKTVVGDVLKEAT
jgi:DNA-binding NarL/FixJ family response regulator